MTALYIVATPIGNLADISLRAIDILKSVSLIAAEDTRHSKPLLQHYEINTRCVSLHQHNEQASSQGLIAKLLAGESVALISDAGTPLISDPGAALVNLAKEQGIRVVPVPGACAAIAALSASGLPAASFSFEGFMSSKSGECVKKLQGLTDDPRTLIFYEAPHRIVQFVKNLIEAFGGAREAAIAREITKTFETIYKDDLCNVLEFIESDPNQQRGEFVVLVSGKQDTGDKELSQEHKRVLKLLLEELPVKKASSVGAKILGASKNELYSYALSLKE